MKTDEKNNLIEWLKEEGVCDLYLINLDVCKDIGTGIEGAFMWRDIPEGFKFRYDVMAKYDRGGE